MLRLGDSDVYGEEVNIASKLGEDTARTNEILLTQRAHQALGEFEGVTFEELDAPLRVADKNFRVNYPLKT